MRNIILYGGKPNEIVQNDAKLVFSDLTKSPLRATDGKYRTFQVCLGTKSKQTNFEQRFARNSASICSSFTACHLWPCHLGLLGYSFSTSGDFEDRALRDYGHR